MLLNAGHTPDGDTSYVVSLLKTIAGGFGLVAITAAAFWVVGQVGAADEVAIDDAPPPTLDPAAGGATEFASEPAPSTPPPAATETATSEPSATPTATASRPGIDPATITIQILDGILDDGGEMAGKVGTKLRNADYAVVVINRSVRVYSESAVFYTRGNQEEAEQIADMLDIRDVQPKPANLSDSVKIHLVVGRDAA